MPYEPPVPQKNPADLLQLQADLLSLIYQTQLKQQRLLEQGQLQPVQAPTGTVRYVEVVDFNMPFLSLVGFLVKFALAGIPAALILMVMWTVLFFALSLVLGMLGLGLGALGGR